MIFIKLKKYKNEDHLRERIKAFLHSCIMLFKMSSVCNVCAWYIFYWCTDGFLSICTRNEKTDQLIVHMVHTVICPHIPLQKLHFIYSKFHLQFRNKSAMLILLVNYIEFPPSFLHYQLKIFETHMWMLTSKI